MKAVTLNSIVSVIRARRGFKRFLSEFIDECKIVDAIEISNNATNGDMIKAMFPNLLIGYVGEISVLTSSQNGEKIEFDSNWWNAPYKTESEE